MAAFLAAGLARGQGLSSPSVGGQMPGVETNPNDPGVIIEDSPRVPGNVPFYSGPQSLLPPTTEAPAPPPGHYQLSSWMLYPRSPGCCGPTGSFGPIAAELFFQVGPSFPIGGGAFGHEFGVGWDIEGGARTLLFNPQCDAAWAIVVSASNINNHASDQSEKFNLNGLTTGQTGLVITNPATGLPSINASRAAIYGINPSTLNGTTTQVLPQFPVTVRELNRTYVSLGLGHDWYLWGPAHVVGISPGELPNLRVGVEFGGRWGTADLRLNEITNREDTIGALYCAVYSDFEYPWHCCVFMAGLRLEYSYTWDDVLQHQNPSDAQDINLLVTAGVRF
jgi:hypothetical protein